MNEECVFCQNARGTMPASIGYEDAATLAFVELRQYHRDHGEAASSPGPAGSPSLPYLVKTGGVPPPARKSHAHRKTAVGKHAPGLASAVGHQKAAPTKCLTPHCKTGEMSPVGHPRVIL